MFITKLLVSNHVIKHVLEETVEARVRESVCTCLVGFLPVFSLFSNTNDCAHMIAVHITFDSYLNLLIYKRTMLPQR